MRTAPGLFRFWSFYVVFHTQLNSLFYQQLIPNRRYPEEKVTATEALIIICLTESSLNKAEPGATGQKFGPHSPGAQQQVNLAP